jgi:hypothetical protein
MWPGCGPDVAPARAVDEVMSRVLEDGALVDHASPLEGGLHAAGLDHSWADCPGCLRSSLDLALREGDGAGRSPGKKGRLDPGCLDRWGAAIGLVVAAVTLAIGAFIVLVVAVSLSRLGEHSGDCDAWTDQCAEPLDDFGDYPLGP